MAETNPTLTEPQRQWVAALRSGKYKQATHVLARLGEGGEPVGFCCLGVACELAIKAGVDITVDTARWEAHLGKSTVPIRTYDKDRAFLPPAVANWLGLVDVGGKFDDGSLASHNDAGKPFERIADIIESKPSGLFVETQS